MKRKNGFTMVEMLGVVVLLAVICLLAFPPMLEQFRKSKNEISKATLQLITSGAEEYVNDRLNDFPSKQGNVYCVSLREIVENGYLNEPVVDVMNDTEYDLDLNVVKITYDKNKFQYALVRKGLCTVKK